MSKVRNILDINVNGRTHNIYTVCITHTALIINNIQFSVTGYFTLLTKFFISQVVKNTIFCVRRLPQNVYLTYVEKFRI